MTTLDKNYLILNLKNILISFCVVVISFFIVIFISKKITTITSNVNINKKLQNTLQERSTLLGKLKSDMAIVDDNDKYIQNAFPSSDNISDFVSTIESTAFKNAVSDSIHFSTPAKSEITSPFQVDTIDFNNSLSGNLSIIIGYMKEFEALPYFVKMNSLNISSQDAMGIVGDSSSTYGATLYTKNIQ